MGTSGRVLRMVAALGCIGALLVAGVVCNDRRPAEVEPPESAPPEHLGEEGLEPVDAAPSHIYSAGAETLDQPAMTRKAPPAGPASRVGARRVATFQESGYYASYELRKDLRLEELDRALDDDPLAFEINALKERSALEGEPGFAVDRAGELVALALGQQLESMGYLVALSFGPDDKKWEIVARGQVQALDLLVAVHGYVGFRIEQAREGDSYRTTATLDGFVTFHRGGGDEGAAAPKQLCRVDFETRKAATSASLEDATGDPRKVATEALAEAIAEILSDPGLEPALVTFVQKSRKDD